MGVSNAVYTTFDEIIINVEQVIHQPILKILQYLQSGVSSYSATFKIRSGDIRILVGEIVERSSGFVSDFISSQVPHEVFTGKFGPVSCKSDILWEKKFQLSHRERF